eukprot:CAMPEP_0206182746 /NCGR_PEP_ID=MMETSP0166-20121206/242_1 /ASSEMBLY_ACC=CAM_ASM_000260 /TAXON_ID=95228 /ORGANISM="Vannella robusta, Strain DIVA3 518/3/11/1/6" /LENGTH=161 /DNA_ID=CAMNT_0053597501 /DNA_START=220 /DNA_END=705 /DNA_ORIENTATION=-
MNPRIKRPPYPHITILAPFVKYQRFDDAKRILQEKLQNVQPFTMEINAMEIYFNNTSFTLYLKPEVQPANVLHDIHKQCLEEFPQCTKGPFDPHIGIGYFKKRNLAVSHQRKYQANWRPMKFVVQELYMMHRAGKDSPFEVRGVVSLGGKNPPPLMPPKPL